MNHANTGKNRRITHFHRYPTGSTRGHNILIVATRPGASVLTDVLSFRVCVGSITIALTSRRDWASHCQGRQNCVSHR